MTSNILHHHMIYYEVFPPELWEGRHTAKLDIGDAVIDVDYFSSGWFTYIINMDCICDRRGGVNRLVTRHEGEQALGIEFGNVVMDAINDQLISVVKGDRLVFTSYDHENGFLYARKNEYGPYKMSSKSQIDQLVRRGFPLPRGYENTQRAFLTWEKGL